MIEPFEDPWSRYGFVDEDNPDSIIHEVSLNVLSILKDHILSVEVRDPYLLVLGGRKASHLISRHDRDIDEHGFLRCFIRLFNSNVWTAKPGLPDGLPAVVFLDSIHTGFECSKIIERLQTHNIDISRISCYLLNEIGLSNLMEKELVHGDEVINLFSSSSEEQYEIESNKLQVFYRSRIEPMDPDVSYDLYDVDIRLTEHILKNILMSFNGIIFDNNIEIDISEDRGFASNIKELSYIYNEGVHFKDLLLEVINENFDVNIDGVCIRFKINQKIESSEFTAIIEWQGNCQPIIDRNNKDCLTDESLCLFPKINHNVSEEMIKKIICPQCVFQYLSNIVLEQMRNQMKELFKDKGINFVVKRTYRPFK